MYSNASKENVNRRLSIRVQAEDKIVRKTKKKKKSVQHTAGLKPESGKVNQIPGYKNS